MLFATGARNPTVDVPAGTKDLSRGVAAFTLSLQASREQAQQLSGKNTVCLRCGSNFLLERLGSMFSLPLMLITIGLMRGPRRAYKQLSDFPTKQDNATIKKKLARGLGPDTCAEKVGIVRRAEPAFFCAVGRCPAGGGARNKMLETFSYVSIDFATRSRAQFFLNATFEVAIPRVSTSNASGRLSPCRLTIV